MKKHTEQQEAEQLDRELKEIARTTQTALIAFEKQLDQFNRRRQSLIEEEAKISRIHQAHQTEISVAQEKLFELLQQAKVENEKYKAETQSLHKSNSFLIAEAALQLPSRTERSALLVFHYKVLSKFFDEQLKNHSFLMQLREKLQLLFNTRTDNRVAQDIYDELIMATEKVPFRPKGDKYFPKEAAEEFAGYLRALHFSGLLANSKYSFSASSLDQAFESFFHQKPKSLIEKYYRTGETAPQALAGSLQALSKLQGIGDTIEIKKEITRLEQTKPAQDNASLKQYTANLKSAVQTLEKAKTLEQQSKKDLTNIQTTISSFAMTEQTLNILMLN